MNIIDKVSRRFKQEQINETKIEKDMFTADQVQLQQEYNETKSKLQPEIQQHIQNLTSSYPFFKDYAIYKIYKKFDFNRPLVEEQIQVLIQSQKDVEWDNNSEQNQNDWIEINKNSKHALVNRDFLKQKKKEELLQMKKDRSYSPQNNTDRQKFSKRRTKSEGRRKETEQFDISPFQPKFKTQYKEEQYSRNQEKERERRNRRTERPRNESPSRKPKKNFEKVYEKPRVIYVPKVTEEKIVQILYKKKYIQKSVKQIQETPETYEKRNNVFKQRTLYVPKIQSNQENQQNSTLQDKPSQQQTQDRARSRTPDKIRDIIDSSPNEQPVLCKSDTVKDELSQLTPQNTPVDQSFSKTQLETRDHQKPFEQKQLSSFEQAPIEQLPVQQYHNIQKPENITPLEQKPKIPQTFNQIRQQIDDPSNQPQNIPFGYALPIYQYPPYGTYSSFFYQQPQVQQPAQNYQFQNLGQASFIQQSQFIEGQPNVLGQPFAGVYPQPFPVAQQPPMMMNPLMYQPQFINPPNFQLNLNYDSLFSLMMQGQQQIPNGQFAQDSKFNHQ